MWKQTAVLRYVARTSPQLDRRDRTDVHAVHDDRSGLRLDESIEAAEEGGLPRPTLANKRHRAASPDAQTDVVERDSVAEATGDVPSLQCRAVVSDRHVIIGESGNRTADAHRAG